MADTIIDRHASIVAPPALESEAWVHPQPVPADTLFPKWRGREAYRHRLDSAFEALIDEHAGLADAIAELPFDRFEALARPSELVHRYNHVPAEARALLDRLPEPLRSAWLSALTLWNIRNFDEAFAKSGLASEFALHYADAFNRIIDQIAERPDFASLASDSFLKDLWLARVVMIPAFAQVWWPHSGLSAKSVLGAGPAAARYVFLRCGGRRPLMEGHTHDPVAGMYWNEKGWGEALRLAALALPSLPHLRGVFGTAWFYDPAILEVSPRISFAQALQVGRGAHRLRIGSNEAAVANATAVSASRRKLYEEGKYLPTDYAIIWSRCDLLAAYGPAATAGEPTLRRVA